MILAIDPGLATGIATLSKDGEFESFIVTGGESAMWAWIQSNFEWWVLDAVVIENFIPRGGALSVQLDALHIIGAVQYICFVHKIPLIIQSPAQAKSFATNEKLKAVGWYHAGTEGHDNDAARHLLVAAATGKVGTAARDLVLERLT